MKYFIRFIILINKKQYKLYVHFITLILIKLNFLYSIIKCQSGREFWHKK